MVRSQFVSEATAPFSEVHVSLPGSVLAFAKEENPLVSIVLPNVMLIDPLPILIRMPPQDPDAETPLKLC